MMTDRQQLDEMTLAWAQVNAAWSADKEAWAVELQALRVELAAQQNDYHALAKATGVLTADRETLKSRVVELEAMVNRLTDMLWGRRSERRTYSTTQSELDFGDASESSPATASELPAPEIIAAQQAAQAAYDLDKLKQLAARREARRQRGKDVETFPPHFERRVRVIDLTDAEKQGLELLRVKISERMRFEKPKVFIEQIQRPEYIKPNAPELGVQSAPPPPAIIEGCKYDFSIIAAIVMMKFAFHNPTYRLQDFFGQFGWRPSRSTSNDLINYAVDCIVPLFEQMWHALLQQDILLGDDTTITVLLREPVTPPEQAVLDTRKKKRQKAFAAQLSLTEPPPTTSSNGQAISSAPSSGSATSYAWLYTGLDAPPELRLPSLAVESPVVDLLPDESQLGNSPPSESPRGEPPPSESPQNLSTTGESPPDFSAACWRYAPYNIFHWSLTHQNSVIDAHLEDFHGTFVGDAASVNARLAARSGDRIRHQSCNAHARREFVKAESNDPLLASQMVSMFQQLYAVEYRAAGLTSAERLELRRVQAVPVWQKMEAWLSREDVKRVLPKSALGQAIGYLKNQWSALRLYLTDGELPFDNNVSERIIRPLTIGRNNWLFLGSVQAAPGRMKLFSVISSAQRHCLSIQDYLEDIFLKLSQAAQHRPQDLELGSALLMSLLPDRWAATHPQHIHQGRLEERKQIAENKQYYRLQAGLAGNHPYGPHNL
jgi:transposase